MAGFRNLSLVASWGRLIPGIRDAFMRFPLPFICVISATIISLLVSHHIRGVVDIHLAKILASLFYTAVALTALQLLSESRQWSLRRYIITALVVIIAVLLYVWLVFDKALFTYSVYFIFALLLSLIFSPYLGRGSSQSSVWYFNYQTGVAIFFAGVSALVLALGMAIILLSLHYLFDLKIHSNLYADIWIVSWGALFPVYVLANISRQFDFEEQACRFPAGIRFITNYIFMPLMLVYLVILYAYFVKILVQWQLPRGYLTWMIAAFGSIGIATRLLAYPIRHDGTRLLKWFYKYYFIALIVPIIVLAIAIGVRIHQYGLTEKRYTIVLMAVWFVIVALFTLFKKDRFHIKYIPMILAALLLLGSMGPWGAVELSLNSQMDRFESFLIKHHLLANNQIVTVRGEMSFRDRKKLSSYADYLCNNELRYQRIRPWLKTLIRTADNRKYLEGHRLSGAQLVRLMGVSYVSRWQTKAPQNRFEYSFHFFDYNNAMIDVAGFDYVGQGSIYQYGKTMRGQSFDINHQGKRLKLTLKKSGTEYTLRTNDGEQVSFDIIGVVRRLQQQHTRTLSKADRGKMVLNANSRDGHLKARLLLKYIQGTLADNNTPEIKNIRFVLLLKFSEP